MISNIKTLPLTLPLSLKGRGNKSGITLTELMMTCAIIAVVIAAGFVGFSEAVRIQDAQGAADRIGYAIKEARYFSRAKGIKTSINCPIGASTFAVFAGEQVISEENRIDALSGNLPGNTKILVNTCEDIMFNENGKPIDTDGNNIYTECAITVGYESGAQKTVVIAGGTGNVDIR